MDKLRPFPVTPGGRGQGYRPVTHSGGYGLVLSILVSKVDVQEAPMTTLRI